MHGEMDGGGWLDEWVVEWVNEWINETMDKWMGNGMNRWKTGNYKWLMNINSVPYD